jgi:transposase
MLHAGLDLSRKRLDVCLITEDGELAGRLAAPPDADGLRGLVARLAPCGEPVHAVIESMTGARFVHDTLEELGWDVEIADAQKVKGLAPLACKTDKIDAQVLAVLSHRDLVPAIWLPDPRVRREREQARFRLHLVKHKSSLKNRVHSTMITFGHPCPVTDLFGVAGRQLLDRLEVPQPWRDSIDASLDLIDYLERQISTINVELKAGGADHPYVPLLLTVPGVGWVLAFTIAAEIGDITRFPSAKKLCGYTGLCPRVNQSGDKGPPRPADQAGPEVPALGDARSHDARAQAPDLLRALPAQQAPPGQAARRQGRPGRHRQKAHRSDLADAHPLPALLTHHRSGRRRVSSGRLTALFGHAPPEPASNVAWSSRRGGNREMSAARHPQRQRGP